ncbi:MAG: protein-glutamate methylesterase/protein-glutamine glutaminase [Bacteriovorax sp.]
MTKKIKVLLVDDSAVVRQVVQEILSKHRDIELRVAQDPIFAKEKMKSDWPDVLILDMEMPRMDGLTFLKQIMNHKPTPVIVCSSLTEKGAEITLQALSAGAFSIMTKPTLGVKDFLNSSSSSLVNLIRSAGLVRTEKLQRKEIESGDVVPSNKKLTADAILSAPNSNAMVKTTEHIIAIGTSTGGTQALEYILPKLPRTCPGIAIVQHMPEHYTKAFAARLNSLSQIEIREAANGDVLHPGLALIAPGGKHMLIKRSGAKYYAEIIDGPLVSRHRPSVDVLFRSVASYAGSNAIGVIMTGMGDDGARGLKELFDAGAKTIAQDEDSCVVFGMPKEAIKLGGAREVMSLDEIIERIRA